MKKKYFTIFILILFSIKISAQKAISIPFNPKTNEAYEYTIKSYTNSSFSSSVTLNGKYTITFKKEDNNYTATDKFSKLQIFDKSELIFSLNLKQEDFSRQAALKHYFNKVKLQRTFDKNGNQISSWDTSFITNNPYIRESDKKRISMVVDQLKAANSSTNFYNKKLTIGESFNDDNLIDNQLMGLNNKNLTTNYKLLGVIANQAIFKYDATLYTATRNRRREITGKEKVTVEGLTSIDLKSGMPVHIKAIVTKGESQAITIITKKGEISIDPTMLSQIEYNHNRYIEFTPREEEPTVKNENDIFYVTKKEATAKLNSIPKFIKFDSFSKTFGSCFYLKSDNSKFEKALDISMLNVEGVAQNGEILFKQVSTTKENTIHIFIDEHFPESRLTSSFCDLKIDHVKVTYKLSVPFGLNKQNLTIENYKTKDKNIINWNKNNITITYGPVLRYYNKQGKRIRPIGITYNYLPTNTSQILGINKTDITATEAFLFYGIDPEFKGSFTYKFKENVAKIESLKPKGNAEITKTIKLFPSPDDD